MYHVIFAGTGIIGAGLACNALTHHLDVTLYDIKPAEEMKKSVKDILERMAKAKVISPSEIPDYVASLKTTNDLEDVCQNADALFECLPERLEIKQNLYKKVQAINPDLLIASSTTAMFPSTLQKGMINPERILVGHPFNPSYMIPLIEIVGGQASAESIDQAKAIYTAMGKKPIVCQKEVNGYIVQRANWAMFKSLLSAVTDGVASVEDIDTAFTYGPGMRAAILGQLLALDLGAKGGYAAMAEKYGDALKTSMGIDPDDMQSLIDGIAKEKEDRPKALGNTNEEIETFRDQAIAIFLKDILHFEN